MEKVKGLLKPRPTPQQQLREWQRKLRNECRVLDRQIRGSLPHLLLLPPTRDPTFTRGLCLDVQREEKNVEKSIREAAKRNDIGSAKALAKELVRSRRAVNRLYENKAQLNSVSMHLGEIVATARTVGHLSKSAEVMKIVNNLMKAPELAATMQEFSKEMTKAGVMEEMVNDAVDSALDSEDMEEEIEEEVDKVLASVAGETASQLPDAVRKQRINQASTSRVPEERQAVAEGADDDEEDLEEIRARLAKVRS
ncbi:vacuolar protein sorting-associated protein 24 homolog 1-like isoform X1 [Oryza glaberrima]|uniref:vacuolar protein sorting-associated protein 24 homolog 1-like isoform X1 n=1 Tax=Oryza glaberrima TaxID=4538 RepID=UPI00224C11E0|nr:vacuolar protein sorting-associated protein 24 homolog 1-like isoform X1 [Oryza glaberrima]